MFRDSCLELKEDGRREGGDSAKLSDTEQGWTRISSSPARLHGILDQGQAFVVALTWKSFFQSSRHIPPCLRVVRSRVLALCHLEHTTTALEDSTA